MKIASSDGKAVVEIIRNNSQDHLSTFTLKLKREAPSAFEGCNDSIHFSSIPKFEKQLSEFLNTRSGEVKLDGTEDCFVVFFRWNGKGDVGIRVQVSKYVNEVDPLRTCVTTCSSMFPIQSECVNEIENDFKALFANHL